MFTHPKENIKELYVREGMTVADLGAGSGFYTLELAKKVGPSGQVYAVEIQKELGEKLVRLGEAEGLKNIFPIWGDLEKMGGTKIGDGVVDIAVVANVLFQVQDKMTVAGEVKRILKNGGKVLVVDWSEFSDFNKRLKDHIFAKKDARILFERAGLKYAQDIKAGEHHYGMIFEKI